MADRPGGGRKGGGGGNKKRRRKAARGGEPSRSRSAQQPLPSQPPPSPLPVIVRAPLHALLQSLAKLIQQVRGKNNYNMLHANADFVVAWVSYHTHAFEDWFLCTVDHSHSQYFTRRGPARHVMSQHLSLRSPSSRRQLPWYRRPPQS